ncbi:MAG: hypothetical protein ACP5VE_11815 [Chthonomonadales bacterium]
MKVPKLLGLLLICSGTAPLGAWARPRHRVFVIVVPGLEAKHFAQPEMARLGPMVSQCATGWMVARTATVPGARPLPQSVVAAELATLGAGARAAPPTSCKAAVSSALGRQTNPVPAAAAAFERGSSPLDAGRGAARSDAALSALIRQIECADRRLDYPVHLGALGSLLHSHGWHTAVAGNAGPCRSHDPSPILLAMDEHGEVDRAATGIPSVIRNAEAPFGCESTFEGYRLIRESDFGVYAFGDLARAQAYAPLCLPKMAALHTQKALAGLASQILSTWRSLGPRDCLVVIGVPSSVEADYKDLAPILVAGSGVAPGLLMSPSTHRRGVVVNTDFLPWVLTVMGASVPGWAEGRAMESSGQRVSLEQWLAVHREAVGTARLQETLGGLPSLQLLLVLLIAADAAGPLGGRWIGRLSSMFAAAILALPAAELLLPALHPNTLTGGALMLAGALWAVGIIGVWPGSRRRLPAILCALLVFPLTADVLVGGRLLSRAWMGSSVTVGARYFGIGNEYGGALLSAVLVIAASGFAWRIRCQKETPRDTAGNGVSRPEWWAMSLPLILLSLGVVVGAPSLGANFGCALAFFVSGAAAAVYLVPMRHRRRWVGAAAFVVCALAILVMVADLLRPPAQQTHLGRVLQHPRDAIVIARRKVALNLRLAVHSPWSAAGIVASAAMWLVWRSRRGNAIRMLGAYPEFRALAFAFLWGVAAMLVLNDSGVVAAAEMLLLAAAALWLFAGSGDFLGPRVGGTHQDP